MDTQYFLIGKPVDGGDEEVLDSSNLSHFELTDFKYLDYKEFRVLKGSLEGVKVG